MIGKLIWKDIAANRAFLWINAFETLAGGVLYATRVNPWTSMGLSLLMAQAVQMAIWPLFPLILQEKDRRTLAFLHSLPAGKEDLVVSKILVLLLLTVSPSAIAGCILILVRGPLPVLMPLGPVIALLLGAQVITVTIQGGVALITESVKAVGAVFGAVMFFIFVVTSLAGSGKMHWFVASLWRITTDPRLVALTVFLELGVATALAAGTVVLYRRRRVYV